MYKLKYTIAGIVDGVPYVFSLWSRDIKTWKCILSTPTAFWFYILSNCSVNDVNTACCKKSLQKVDVELSGSYYLCWRIFWHNDEQRGTVCMIACIQIYVMYYIFFKICIFFCVYYKFCYRFRVVCCSFLLVSLVILTEGIGRRKFRSELRRDSVLRRLYGYFPLFHNGRINNID